MKRILFTTVSFGVLSLVSPALAADLTPYTRAPAIAAPMYNWSGFYVGVFGGGGFGNHNIDNANGFAGASDFTANYESKGGIAGGEIGYNVQSGNYLFGVEADGFWSGIKGNDAAAVAAGSFAVTAIDATSLRNGATLRARGGITVDRLLLFFTAGWAYGNFRHTNTDVVFGLGVDQFTANRSGMTAGGGIAYGLTDNLIGKIEYRYYDYGSFNRDGLPFVTANGQLPYSVKSTFSVVTVGLDFKLGGPVIAKY